MFATVCQTAALSLVGYGLRFTSAVSTCSVIFKGILRWPYCLTITGCNFVSNDLLHQTLISYNGPWFTFPFMDIWWNYDDVIKFYWKSYFFDNSLFLKKWNHPSNSNFASSISMIISLKILAFEDNCLCFQVTSFFYQKSEFWFKMFINSALYFTKRPITGKQKQ